MTSDIATATAVPARTVVDEAARLHVPNATAVKAIGDQDFRIRLDQSLVTTMQSQARWAVRAGFGDGGTHGIDLLHAIEPGPLRKAAPDAVGLVQ